MGDTPPLTSLTTSSKTFNLDVNLDTMETVETKENEGQVIKNVEPPQNKKHIWAKYFCIYILFIFKPLQYYKSGPKKNTHFWMTICTNTHVWSTYSLHVSLSTADYIKGRWTPVSQEGGGGGLASLLASTKRAFSSFKAHWPGTAGGWTHREYTKWMSDLRARCLTQTR